MISNNKTVNAKITIITKGIESIELLSSLTVLISISKTFSNDSLICFVLLGEKQFWLLH